MVMRARRSRRVGRVRCPGASGRCRVVDSTLLHVEDAFGAGVGDAAVVDYFVVVAVDDAHGTVGSFSLGVLVVGWDCMGGTEEGNSVVTAFAFTPAFGRVEPNRYARFGAMVPYYPYYRRPTAKPLGICP